MLRTRRSCRWGSYRRCAHQCRSEKEHLCRPSACRGTPAVESRCTENFTSQCISFPASVDGHVRSAVGRLVKRGRQLDARRCLRHQIHRGPQHEVAPPVQATLARARRAALSKAQKHDDDEQKPSLDQIAEQAARRREAAHDRDAQGGKPACGPQYWRTRLLRKA